MEPSQREECWRLHGEMPGFVSPPNSAFQSWMHLESPNELKNTDNSFPLSGILAKFYTWRVAQAILKLPEWCVQPGCIGRSFWVSCDTPCTRGDQESSDPCSSWCGSWKGYGFSCPPNTHNVKSAVIWIRWDKCHHRSHALELFVRGPKSEWPCYPKQRPEVDIPVCTGHSGLPLSQSRETSEISATSLFLQKEKTRHVPANLGGDKSGWALTVLVPLKG